MTIVDRAQSPYVSVINAVDSVSLDNFEEHLKLNPEKRILWKDVIFGHIRHLKQCGYSSVRLCDLGCGLGTQIAHAAEFAQHEGLAVDATLIDKTPGNVLVTKNKLKALGVENVHCNIGDVTKHFPEGKFDFVFAFELIHWFTNLKDVDNLFANIAGKMDINGMLAISYANKNNNAALTGPDSHLVWRRAMKEAPISRFSSATKSYMTFVDDKYITELANRHNLKCNLTFEALVNFDFPTRPSLIAGLRRIYAGQENTYQVFTVK